jgi:hypothetical protein
MSLVLYPAANSLLVGRVTPHRTTSGMGRLTVFDRWARPVGQSLGPKASPMLCGFIILFLSFHFLKFPENGINFQNMYKIQ